MRKTGQCAFVPQLFKRDKRPTSIRIVLEEEVLMCKDPTMPRTHPCDSIIPPRYRRVFDAVYISCKYYSRLHIGRTYLYVCRVSLAAQTHAIIAFDRRLVPARRSAGFSSQYAVLTFLAATLLIRLQMQLYYIPGLVNLG